MTFDLTKVEAEKAQDATGTVVALRDRYGEPDLDADGQPVTMTVLGFYSEPVQRARAGNKRAWKRAERTGAGDDTDDEEAVLNILVAAVTAWSGVVTGGQPIPFTPENARRVLRAVEWWRDQVWARVQKPKLFTSGASANS